jgi:sialate O-acetylesterase
MQFKLWESNEPKENYKGNKNVRLFTVDRMEEGEHFKAKDGWVELSSDNAQHFSAIGYYVAQALAKDDRKIGLIACYQGASVIQSWMSKEYALVPEFKIENRFADHVWFPVWNDDGVLYENMLSKIIPYSMASVLWYQGESNASVDEANIYLEFLRALITNWRKDFCDDKLNFIIIQLADHLDRAGYAWSKIQEQQLLAQDKIPNVKTVICRDVCDNIDIHPKEKDILSKRIAELLK